MQCGRGGGVVAVHPSPVTDIIMFHPDPPQYMYVVRNRDGVGSMLNLSAISLLVNMESYRKNNL